MTRFTKEQRHQIYKVAVNHRQSPYSMCIALESASFKVVGSYLTDDEFKNIVATFPELAKYEPQSHGEYWFPKDEEGTAKRKAILEQCIKETA